MTRISSLPNLLARSGGGPQPAPVPTNTSCIRAPASELTPDVCPTILARNYPVRAERPFDFNTPVAEQMLKHAHRPQTRDEVLVRNGAGWGPPPLLARRLGKLDIR